MATKPLPSQEVLRQLLDYDPETGALTWKKRTADFFPDTPHRMIAVKRWNKKNAGKPALNVSHGNGYFSGSIFKNKTYAHRAVWKWMTGEDPDFVDHINGIRDDNRWVNLRSATRSENSRNAARPHTNTSGYVGVSYNRDERKWAAYIGDSPRKRLGRFRCVTAAAVARKRAETHHGYHRNHGR